MIIDLRDYTTTPGNRDRLIERCESVLFVEQERLGATFCGTFRDANDPDRFVWLRGMPDLPTRKRVLTDFYTNGEMWKAQRKEVNSWIADSDNVLLVRPISEWAARATGDSVVAMYSCLGPEPLSLSASSEWRTHVEQAVNAHGGRLLVTMATDPTENNYPRHPIRTGEHGLIWFATFKPSAIRSLGIERLNERRLIPTSASRMR